MRYVDDNMLNQVLNFEELISRCLSKNSLALISFDNCDVVVCIVAAGCSLDISDCVLGDNGGCVLRLAVDVP